MFQKVTVYLFWLVSLSTVLIIGISGCAESDDNPLVEEAEEVNKNNDALPEASDGYIYAEHLIPQLSGTGVYGAKIKNFVPLNNSVIIVFDRITLQFDQTPRNVRVKLDNLAAHISEVITSGDIVVIEGYSPPGLLKITVKWDGGIQSLSYIIGPERSKPATIIGGTLTDGDKDVNSKTINAVGLIVLTFDEDIKGTIALRTIDGDDVGWLGKVKGNKATLELVKGKEIRNGTTYVIAGKVSDDDCNDTPFIITFETKGKP